MLNYDYISEELCENKDKPELQCEGKCYLKQSLAEASADDDHTGEIPLKKLDFQLLYFIEKSPGIDNSEYYYKNPLKINAEPGLSYHYILKSQIFRPPMD